MSASIEPLPRQRIASIDLLRGLVMVIMALDHVRDYFGQGSFANDPMDLGTTTPALFFTRWITHFCAPVFVFLSGTSAFLYGSRAASTAVLSRFLWTRGLWLIVMELTVIRLGWTFDLSYQLSILQVIWAIGVSMVVLAALVHLPRLAIAGVGGLLVAGHNLLDPVHRDGTDALSVLWQILHQGTFLPLGENGAGILVAYPVLPWIGLMALGYVFGGLYAGSVDVLVRRRTLIILGGTAVAAFLLIRGLNGYGDPAPWSGQAQGITTFLSFLKVTKYPPSLAYVLMTIGPAMLFLAWSEQWRGRLTEALVTIGRVPFFYYIAHLYLIHALAFIGLAVQGFPLSHMVITPSILFSDVLLPYGYPLWVVYAVWIVVVLLLYPLCRWYGNYRAGNRDKWWLSYL